MNIVKSPEARNKIRQWFKKEKREDNILHGKQSFESELRRVNLQMSDITREDVLPKVLKKISFDTFEELFAAIGYGGMPAQKPGNRIREELRSIERSKRKDDSEPMSYEIRPDKRTRPIHGIMVEGLDNCLVKFARCCTPVPGDGAIGFITRGFGVSVHRKDCKNYLKSVETPEEAGRWVRVTWANSAEDVYSTAILITARERSGIVMDIATILNALKIRMTSLTAKDVAGGITTVAVVIEVKNRDELTTAINRLSALSGILEIKRASG
jgi:GTP pyrophosphokinase